MLKLKEVLAEYRPTDTLYEISLQPVFEFFSPVKISGFYGSCIVLTPFYTGDETSWLQNKELHPRRAAPSVLKFETNTDKLNYVFV